MTSELTEFYNNHIEKIKLVVSGIAQSAHKEFYELVWSRKWLQNKNLSHNLLKYLNTNIKSINKSLSLLGIKHNEINHQAEQKLKKSKPFLNTITTIKPETILSDEVDKLYKSDDLAQIKAEFKRPDPNKNPKVTNSRDDLINSATPVTIINNYDILNNLPSTSRNIYKYINLGIEGHEYYEHFKPNTKPTLYKKSQAKKFVGPRGTWMFDLMYFSDYNTKKYRKQAIYLIGININTRFAVCRRVNGKSVKDLIPAFESLLQNELKNKISLLIFDGEKAISSKAFEDYCKNHNINVRITYPGIHTQTAPIDRLCRTIRDYFTKFYMHKHGKINRIHKFYDPWKDKQKYDTIITEAIKIRKLFNGEDRFKIAPIPMEYAIYFDKYKDDYIYILKVNDNSYDLYNKKNDIFTFEKFSDELYDVVDYYNNKSHNGLIKLLKYAASTFKKSLNYTDNEITPRLVNENPYLESMIIQYCRYYNSDLVEQGEIFNIGDKVQVYDCFTTDRGALQRNNNELLIGNWEIVSKDNEIYGVYNNENNQLLHVSKYMLRPLVATSN